LSENKAAIHEALLDINKELKVTTKEEDAKIKNDEAEKEKADKA